MFVCSFLRSVGRTVSCWKLCHSKHVLGAKTDAASSPRVSLSLSLFFLGLSHSFSFSVFLSSSRVSSLSLLSIQRSRSYPLATLITLPFYNAPLCSATAEFCIFLDAMDFPKAFRCYVKAASPLSQCGLVKFSPR